MQLSCSPHLLPPPPNPFSSCPVYSTIDPLPTYLTYPPTPPTHLPHLPTYLTYPLNTASAPPPPPLPPPGASGLCMALKWGLRLQPLPQVDAEFLVALLPVALFHTVGHVAACVSFSQMAVSFAHIVKSAEPVFSVALSGPLLGVYNPW